MAAYQVSTVMSFIGDGWCVLVVRANAWLSYNLASLPQYPAITFSCS